MVKILKITLCSLLFLFVGEQLSAQKNIKSTQYEFVETEKPNPYRGNRTRYFDLIHTKLDVKPDFQKQYLYGTATLTLSPIFYATNQLVLDAKSMEIISVKWTDNPSLKLKHTYDSAQLFIEFPIMLNRTDIVNIAIEYISKPNDYKVKGSKAITSDKGLYFIDPLDTDPNKPTQIWTQGETESNSVWFPTIDSPNEKCTQEISITVDYQWNTLSNGTLTKQIKNADGSHTDTWTMDKPHAPYLFMMAIGDFAIVKDRWKDIPLAYHVDKEFEPYAKDIFGRTPEMLTFFSDILNYPYPWPKYDQVVVRDYVSGAMENTTATIFMDKLQMTKKELIDYNWDDIIAHELFHQWFGDLVTCESWSNLTLNEGFATYAEYLWNEHKYGRDYADYHLLQELEEYIDEAVEGPKNLIRFQYDDKEDMFDNHSYNKGGLVLHMLRNYVGDDAFFSSLNKYLTDNAYKTVELDNLRMAFEETVGEDLHWFFDQWYFYPGHPQLSVEHEYKKGLLTVTIHQMQMNPETPIYKLPLFIDVWTGESMVSHPVLIEEEHEIYEFPMSDKPDLVLFDHDKQLLAEIIHPKTDEELAFQFAHCTDLSSRIETMDSLYRFKSKSLIDDILTKSFNDPYFVIRQYAVEYLIDNKVKSKKYAESIEKLLKDPSSHVRAYTISYVGGDDFEKYKEQVMRALNDESYMVVGSALAQLDKNGAILSPEYVERFSKESNLNIILPMASILAKKPDSSFEWFIDKMNKLEGESLFYFIQAYSEKLIKGSTIERTKAIDIFYKIAIKDSNYLARLSAYQGLILLTDLPGVDIKLKEVKSQEKDERLKELYEQF